MIFFMIYYMDEVEMLVDRIVIIDYGKIIVEGIVEKFKKFVGNDVIYFKFDVFEEFKCFESGFIRGCKVFFDGRVVFEVENVVEVFLGFFEFVNERGIRIFEVIYYRFMFNDVFFYLIGREIRDEGLENLMVFFVRMRMRRR